MNRRVHMWIAAAFLMVWGRGAGLAQSPPDERYFRSHPVGFMEMDQAVEVARSLLSEGSAVIPDRRQQRLLVRATEAEHQQLAAALQSFQRPPPNIRIDVDWEEQADESEGGVSVGAAGGSSGRWIFRLTGQQTSRQTAGRTRQTLVVASGGEAMLRIGEQVPWLEWIEDWGLRQGVLTTRVAWRDVGAFLAVEATLLGDGPYVRLRLTPELSGRVEGRPHRVRFAQAATEVVARLGETISLAGLANNNEFLSRFLVGVDRRGRRSRLNIALTPTLAESTMQAPRREP